MNSAYYYRSARVESNTSSDRDKLCRIHASKPRSTFSLDLDEITIDTVLDLVCSEVTLKIAKAIFAVLALIGCISAVCGAELGAAVLVSSCVCLTLVMFLEYLAHGDGEGSDTSEYSDR